MKWPANLPSQTTPAMLFVLMISKIKSLNLPYLPKNLPTESDYSYYTTLTYNMYTYKNSPWKELNQLVLPLCVGASGNNFVSFMGSFL